MGILKSLEDIRSVDEATVIGNPAIESEIVLMALRNECSSDEEFAQILESAGTEMALYDIISDAEIATEASKKIVVKDFKKANFNRIAKRTAIRMAMVNNDPLYTKYRKYRDLLLETRDKIYTKYQSKATQEARKIIANSRNKATNMSAANGSQITDKMDRQIAKADSAMKRT